MQTESNPSDVARAFASEHCVVVPEAAHPCPGRLVFSGERRDGSTSVLVAAGGQASRQVPLYLGVRKHSPAGFDWGCGGSEPAQLALALCVEVVGRGRAERVYQAVKASLVMPMRGDSWMLSGIQILSAIEDAEQQLAAARQ